MIELTPEERKHYESTRALAKFCLENFVDPPEAMASMASMIAEYAKTSHDPEGVVVKVFAFVAAQLKSKNIFLEAEDTSS